MTLEPRITTHGFLVPRREYYKVNVKRKIGLDLSTNTKPKIQLSVEITKYGKTANI